MAWAYYLTGVDWERDYPGPWLSGSLNPEAPVSTDSTGLAHASMLNPGDPNVAGNLPSITSVTGKPAVAGAHIS
jgi:hypothetical protein